MLSDVLFTEKANRLKAAKKEADAEINAYKAERERQYKEYEARVINVYTCYTDDSLP